MIAYIINFYGDLEIYNDEKLLVRVKDVGKEVHEEDISLFVEEILNNMGYHLLPNGEIKKKKQVVHRVSYKPDIWNNIEFKDTDFIHRFTSFVLFLIQKYGKGRIYSVTEEDEYTFSVILTDSLYERRIYKIYEDKPNRPCSEINGLYIYLKSTIFKRK